jgi:hypothetical protein
MDNNEQRQFVASLRRPQLNHLCLEMQAIILNLKLFLAETHGYSDNEISQIMRGMRHEDLGTTVEAGSPTSNVDPGAQEKPHTKKAKSFTQPSLYDLAKLKQNDEMVRRSMAFELEWCVTQIEHGNYPW